MRIKHFALFGILLLAGLLLTPGCKASTADYGDTVQVDYTGKLIDGTVFDTSAGREPLEFTLGTGQVIAGFEKAVLGMKVGESKTVTVPVSEAYGPHRDELIIEVPKTDLPEGLTPQVGQQLQGLEDNGRIRTVTIVEVSEDVIKVDANHFLAGKDLVFEIKLVSIK